jgi:REP element-mobilizing transposase RayT
MADPVAYFITWTTYGTWLPGDQRGWVKRGEWAAPQPADPLLEENARQLMTEDEVVLTHEQRATVDAVIVDHCRIRRWWLHARNVRTNHVHVVVTATSVHPATVREQLKAWGSRRLSEVAGLRGGGRNGRRRWWTENGDIVFVRGEEHLAQIIRYVTELQ